MLAAAALSMGFTSCNKDNEGGDGGDGGKISGKDTYMQITISQSAAPGTYADDDNASVNESKFSSVDIFIYDEGAQALEVHTTLDAAAFDKVATPGNTENWTMKNNSKITCKTGTKRVLAALNITPGRAQAIANKGYNIFTESQFDVTVYGAGDDALVDLAGRGIAMFSVGTITANLVTTDHADYPTANTVPLPVQRLVSKVTMQQAGSLNLVTSGGTFSDLQFAMATTNKKTYLLRDWGAAGSGAVKDHNWESNSFNVADFNAAYPSTTFAAADYKVVAASGVDVKDLDAHYCPENTSKDFLHKEVTAAVVRCKYLPATVIVYANGTDNAAGYIDEATTVASAQTFYTVSLQGGGKKYFFDPAIAAAYQGDNAGSTLDPTYQEGYCYYRVYLNPKAAARKTFIDNNALATVPQANGAVGPYDVIRNAFYKVTISKIVGPGNPTPEPRTPDEPVSVPTDITANIDIVHWDMVDQDEELTPM